MKNKTKFSFLVVYLLREIIQYYISASAKECKPLRLAGNQELKLESDGRTEAM